MAQKDNVITIPGSGSSRQSLEFEQGFRDGFLARKMKEHGDTESREYQDYRSGFWIGVRHRHSEVAEIGLEAFHEKYVKPHQVDPPGGIFDKVISWFK